MSLFGASGVGISVNTEPNKQMILSTRGGGGGDAITQRNNPILPGRTHYSIIIPQFSSYSNGKGSILRSAAHNNEVYQAQ